MMVHYYLDEVYLPVAVKLFVQLTSLYHAKLHNIIIL